MSLRNKKSNFMIKEKSYETKRLLCKLGFGAIKYLSARYFLLGEQKQEV